MIQKNKDINYLLSNKRFDLNRFEVKKTITQLLKENLINKEDYNTIIDEDILIEIKYKTLKKCKIKAAISALMLTIGVLFKIAIPIFSFFIIFGFIILISSAVGVHSNRLTKKQINYIKTY